MSSMPVMPADCYGPLVKKLLLGLGTLLGAYLIVRAVAEPFVIQFGDPASYRNDWGGPSLPGVLAVHCGPGIVAAVLFVRGALRLRSASRTPGAVPSR